MKGGLVLLLSVSTITFFSCSSDNDKGGANNLSSGTPLVQQVAVPKIAPQPKKNAVPLTPVVAKKPVVKQKEIKANEVKPSLVVPLSPVKSQDEKIVVLPLRPRDM